MGEHERRVFDAPGYEIIERIGGSDGADVYIAEQKALGRRVALKVLHGDGQDPEQAARFEFETRTASQLLHPHIVPLLDSGTTQDGHRWYAMPHLAGGDLASRAALPPAEVRRIALALCDALWYAHSRNVVHRDIKPTNVLFDDTGRPMLADFGIATSIFGRRGLTVPGRILGSARYISPEQARGEKVDPRADLYSLGVVIHEMLTGRSLFDGTDDVALARQHASAPVPRLPAAFGAWQAFFDRALAKDPADRFMSARTMAQALDLIEVPAHPEPVVAPAAAAIPPVVAAAPVLAAASAATAPVDDLPRIRVEAPSYREAAREPARRPPRWPLAVLAAGVLAVVALIAYALSDDRFSPWVPETAPAVSDPPGASTSLPGPGPGTEAKPVAAAPKPEPKPVAKPKPKPKPGTKPVTSPAKPARAREPVAPVPQPVERGEDEAEDLRDLDDDAPYVDDESRDLDLGDAEPVVDDDVPARDELDDAPRYEDDAPPTDDDYDAAPDYRDDPALAPGNWSPPIGPLDLSGPPRSQLEALDAHVDEARRWLEDERYRVEELAQTLAPREAEREYEDFAVQEQAFERWLDRMGALRDRIVRGE